MSSKFEIKISNETGMPTKLAAHTLAAMVLEFYNDPENRRAYEEERKAAIMAAPSPL